MTVDAKPPLMARVAKNDSSDSLVFRVLQLADLHFSGDPRWPCKDAPDETDEPVPLAGERRRCDESLMSAFVDELLDAETPDLVVFSGDNVQTFEPHNRQRAVDAFTRGVEARGIPHAEILGNHDDDYGFAREDVLARAMDKRFSYTQRGPTFEERGVDGVGNYQLSVHAPVSGAWGDAGARVFHMYFLDSGGRVNQSRYPDARSRYDWIHDSQVQLYRELSAANRAAHLASQSAAASSATVETKRNTPLPAIMFFHIPLREYLPASLAFWRRTGAMNEKVEPSDVHSSLFDALVDVGEVKATFAGHDHTNAYCYLRSGIQLCTSCGAGLGVAYSDSEYTRRARVIEWRVNGANERTITSWKRLLGGPAGDAGRFETEVLFSEDRSVRVGLLEPPISSHALLVALHLCAFAALVLMLAASALALVLSCCRRAGWRIPSLFEPSPAVCDALPRFEATAKLDDRNRPCGEVDQRLSHTLVPFPGHSLSQPLGHSLGHALVKHVQSVGRSFAHLEETKAA